jgi:hypothetical protein
MSQFDWGNLDPYVVDGVQLADDLNQFRDALLSVHRGGARPAYAVAGMEWINDAGGAANWIQNLFMGPTIGDRPLFNFDTTTGLITLGAGMRAVTQPGADNSQLLATTAMVQAAIAAAVGAAFPTGMALDLLGNLAVAPAGWVLAMQGTIGNPASAATIRANADCANLFAHLWTLANTEAPVLPGGRGATAAADFAANKTIGGLDLRGLARATADAQGGTAAGRLTTLFPRIGMIAGEQSHVLNIGEIPGHTHNFSAVTNTGSGANLGNPGTWNGAALTTDTGNGLGGGGHNTVQPTRTVTTIIKL